MNILVVGNVLKDVYLSLDPRSEAFERDRHNINWLNLGFNASGHHFFRRMSSFGGAAVSIEVLQNLGLSPLLSDPNFTVTPDGLKQQTPAETYRYILTHDDHVSYLTPSTPRSAHFTEPEETIDYLYIDRSAALDKPTATKIATYLDNHPDTQFILYLKNLDNLAENGLIEKAHLIFTEIPLPDVPLNKYILISDTDISYDGITEPISVNRIDTLTHLSAHSIIAATILGSFLNGETVETSLKLAKVNVENSTLSATLTRAELHALAATVTPENDLELIAASLMLKNKGILAADESGGSIAKKFAQLNLPDTFENRHNYRHIFFTTPHLEDFVNGVILFDETARDHADNGQTYVDFLTSHRIIPGTKVDEGLKNFENSDETYTQGLATLSRRLKEYYQMGCRFAKWRAAFTLSTSDNGEIRTPSEEAITKNCEILAAYAKKCQSAGLVPIVEPEVVYDGYYTIDQCASVTSQVLDELFKQLADYGVNLRACILKVNMIMAGKRYKTASTPEKVGRATAEVLKNHVPEDLAGVVFLSGGQTPEQATANLAAITQSGPFPWPVSFSFARALQDPALFTWQGKPENQKAAQQAFAERLQANVKAIQF